MSILYVVLKNNLQILKFWQKKLIYIGYRVKVSLERRFFASSNNVWSGWEGLLEGGRGFVLPFIQVNTQESHYWMVLNVVQWRSAASSHKSWKLPCHPVFREEVITGVIKWVIARLPSAKPTWEPADIPLCSLIGWSHNQHYRLSNLRIILTEETILLLLYNNFCFQFTGQVPMRNNFSIHEVKMLEKQSSWRHAVKPLRL